jgi:hypothetical protein
MQLGMNDLFGFLIYCLILNVRGDQHKIKSVSNLIQRSSSIYGQNLMYNENLVEHSMVRKCGPSFDDRFDIDCPHLDSATCVDAMECAALCAARVAQECRSWSFNIVNQSCSMYKMTIRGVNQVGFVSGDYGK